jgi:alpha/beta superfamily hydrolase
LRLSTLSEVLVAGPVGAIDVALNDPGPARCGIALIAHPHPLQGGTRENKVVTSLARAFFGLGYCAVRPNFRGVGASEGIYDQGIGEADDLIVLVEHLREQYGDLPVLLAGFSFGAYVQTRVVRQLKAERLVLIAPAVSRFETESVPEDTLVVHGDQDDIVPLSAVLEWARPQNLPVVVIPGGEHFFHGRLGQLQKIVTHWCLGYRGRES